MHEPIGSYRCDISIFAHGCVTVTVTVRQGEDEDTHHVHCGPFPDYEGIGHAARECFALWVAGARGEEMDTRLSAL